MDDADDDLQVAWWRTCDFICSAVDTIVVVAILVATFFALSFISTLIMMVVE